MTSATTALIGTGVGATVAFAGQYLGHNLTRKRDRLNQKRARLHAVVTDAAIALYGMSGDKPYHPAPENPKPGTLGAMVPELSDPTVTALGERMSDALTLLQIHFGDEHPLVDSYMETMSQSTAARVAFVRHLNTGDEDNRISNIKQVAKEAREAQLARHAWVKEARACVDAL